MNTYASVWDASRAWTTHDLEDFSKWVSDSVDKDIFSSELSPYFGIKTDCADVIISLMAIYSKENDLELILKKNGNVLTSNMNLFNSIKDSQDRFLAFLDYLNDLLSTIDIAMENSVSIAPRTITSGDIYVVQWKNTIVNRHLYLIKNVLPTGNLRLFSSTTPQKVRTLSERLGMPLNQITSKPWGFKRVVPANLIDQYKKSENDEQYKLLQRDVDFFNTIKNSLAIEKDTLNQKLRRKILNVCDMFLNRDEEIKYSLRELSKSNICFTDTSFNLHSTYQRDINLKKSLNRLLNGWKKIRNKNYNIDTDIRLTLDYIIRKEGSIGSAHARRFCSLEVSGHPYDLRHLTYAMVYNLLSSDPNLSRKARWGLEDHYYVCKIH
ncbi:MAG: hypothetical protein VX341_01980 [Bdellovibrionota bacterium]|nr:hypothetical protein [Bdellovibrionota bacterium]